MHYFDIAGLLN